MAKVALPGDPIQYRPELWLKSDGCCVTRKDHGAFFQHVVDDSPEREPWPCAAS